MHAFMYECMFQVCMHDRTFQLNSNASRYLLLLCIDILLWLLYILINVPILQHSHTCIFLP